MADSQSKAVSAGHCRLLSRVFSEAVMLRRIVFYVLLGLGVSGCYYYADPYDAYSAPYYYPGYYAPYYYSPYYNHGYYGPRYYGGYRYYNHGYHGGHGSRYYGGGYHGGHH
jgi:hypothetical protein